MSELKAIRAIVYPARDMQASIASWTALLGTAPGYQTPDFAAFSAGEIEIGLSRLPWVEHPLVFWAVEDIEAAHRGMVAAGVTPLGEVAGGSLAALGAAPITNGDPVTGIVSVPGRRLAVLQATDGVLFGIQQDLPIAW